MLVIYTIYVVFSKWKLWDAVKADEDQPLTGYNLIGGKPWSFFCLTTVIF